jgi:hypothetical protein
MFVFGREVEGSTGLVGLGLGGGGHFSIEEDTSSGIL